MVCFVLNEHIQQPLEARDWDGGDKVGVKSLDLYGGYRCYDVFVRVALFDG